MSKKIKISQARTWGDMDRALHQAGAERVSQNGSHVKYTGPKGAIITCGHKDSDQIPKGLRSSIIRMAVAAGLVVSVVGLVVSVVLFILERGVM